MTKSIEHDQHEHLARSLDWNLLRTFIAIVQYGGISRAAEHLHLSQPAVSQGLKRLESRLECKLIERNTRQFEITETGRQIYAKALEIHLRITRLGDIVDSGNDTVTGHIRILLASRIKSKVLDNILQKFHLEYPGITIRIDVLPSIDIQGIIQQGSATVGFCLLRGKPKNIETKLLLRERFGLYCGPTHHLYGKKDLSMDALRKEDLITFPSDQLGGVLSPLTVYREQHFLEGRIVSASHNLDEIIRLTELGVGIGTIPTHEVKDNIKQNKLWALPPYEGIGPIEIHMIWEGSSDFSLSEQAFIDFALSRLPTSSKMADVQ